MSSLGPSTISSSYNRLLVLPADGGDGTNLVSLSDGDGVTEFALKLSTTDIALPVGGKVYFDGGTDTYINGSADGLSFYTNGQRLMKLHEDGSLMWSNSVTIGEENSTNPFIVIQSHVAQPDVTTTVHSIQLGGDNYGGDVLLLGRTDSTGTNISLNAETGVCAYAEYPTGDYVDSGNNNMTFLSSGGPAWFETAKGARGCLITPGTDPYGVALTTNASDAGWSNGYKFVKHSDPRDVLGGFLGYGGGQNAIVRLTMGVAYNSDPGIHYKVSNGFVGIGENDPDAPLHIVHATDIQPVQIHTGGATCALRLEASGTTTGSDGVVGLVCAADVLHMYTNNTSRLYVKSTGVHIGGAGGNSSNEKSLHIPNGVQAGATADQICIGAKDSSGTGTDAKSTLSLYLEEGIDATALDAVGTLTHRIPVWVNGTCYWLYLDPV